MRGVLVLSGLVLAGFSAVATSVSAQTAPPPASGYFTYAPRGVPFVGAQEENPSFSLPFASANHESAMASLRERVASGMVRKGRCDDAARLAQRQNDTLLLKRVVATCALLRAPRQPS